MKVRSLVKGMALAGAVMFASSAMADGFGRGSLKDRGPIAAPFSWTGLYLGAHAGYGWSNADWAWSIPGLAETAGVSSSGSGFVGGGQIGYRQQFGTLVAGVELSYSGGNLDDSRSRQAFGAITRNYLTDVDRLFMATGQLGVAFGRTLVYLKGGFASASVGLRTERPEQPGFTYLAQTSSRHRESGWVIGAGGEYAFTNNLSLGLEYNWINLGSTDRSNVHISPTLASNHVVSDMDVQTLWARLNYKF